MMSAADLDWLEMSKEDTIEMLDREYGADGQMINEFNRAMWWWHEYENWGGGMSAFPREGVLREQPHEWKLSVECVRAAQHHYQAFRNLPPHQDETTLDEGEEGRGPLGDS